MTSSSPVTRSSLQELVPMEDPQPLADLPTRIWSGEECGVGADQAGLRSSRHG
jgi:hypothetical protein